MFAWRLFKVKVVRFTVVIPVEEKSMVLKPVDETEALYVVPVGVLVDVMITEIELANIV